MNEHFKIKNEIDPQCFLTLVCAKTLCSMLTSHEKKRNASFDTYILLMVKAFRLNLWAHWVLVYYKFTTDITH